MLTQITQNMRTPISASVEIFSSIIQMVIGIRIASTGNTFKNLTAAENQKSIQWPNIYILHNARLHGWPTASDMFCGLTNAQNTNSKSNLLQMHSELSVFIGMCLNGLLGCIWITQWTSHMDMSDGIHAFSMITPVQLSVARSQRNHLLFDWMYYWEESHHLHPLRYKCMPECLHLSSASACLKLKNVLCNETHLRYETHLGTNSVLMKVPRLHFNCPASA